MLADTDRESARARAEHLRGAIAEISLKRLGETLPPPTASFGVALYPQDGATPAELLQAADRVLYRAKQEGRDRVCVASEPTPVAS